MHFKLPPLKFNQKNSKNDGEEGDAEEQRLKSLVHQSIRGEQLDEEGRIRIEAAITFRLHQHRQMVAMLSPPPTKGGEETKKKPGYLTERGELSINTFTLGQSFCRRRFRPQQVSSDSFVDREKDWRSIMSIQERQLQNEVGSLLKEIKRLEQTRLRIRFGEDPSNNNNNVDHVKYNADQVWVVSTKDERIGRIHRMRQLNEEKLSKAKENLKLEERVREKLMCKTNRKERRAERRAMEQMVLANEARAKSKESWLHLVYLARGFQLMLEAVRARRHQAGLLRRKIQCVVKIQRWFKRRSGLTFSKREWDAIRRLRRAQVVQKWRNSHKNRLEKQKIASKMILRFVLDVSSITMQFMRISHALRARIVKAQRMVRAYVVSCKEWRENLEEQWEEVQRQEYQRFRMGITTEKALIEANSKGLENTNQRLVTQHKSTVKPSPGKAALLAARVGIRGYGGLKNFRVEDILNKNGSNSNGEGGNLIENSGNASANYLDLEDNEEEYEYHVAAPPHQAEISNVLNQIRERKIREILFGLRRKHAEVTNKNKSDWRKYRTLIFEMVEKASKQNKKKEISTSAHIDRLTTIYPMPKFPAAFAPKITEEEMTQIIRKTHIQAFRQGVRLKREKQ